jgi:hypothetical protein
MTPKEKAIELYYIFTMYAPLHSDNKQCALIAVDEIIEEVREYCDDNFHQDRLVYWQEVKIEIEKL